MLKTMRSAAGSNVRRNGDRQATAGEPLPTSEMHQHHYFHVDNLFTGVGMLHDMASILGLYRDNGKENGNYYIVYWGSLS